jgi:hypothetical protein
MLALEGIPLAERDLDFNSCFGSLRGGSKAGAVGGGLQCSVVDH